jgi:polyhydroxyalkanoate synthase
MALTSDTAAEEPAELQRLGVAESLAGSLDPVGLIGSLGQALAKRTRHPVALGGLLATHAASLTRATAATAARTFGIDVSGPAAPSPKDRRFAEATWQDNPAFYGLLQTYLLNRQLLVDLVEGAALDRIVLAKARFAANLIADALAPTNFLPTNPAALRRAAETGGRSVLRGMRNMVDDVVTNGGWPKQVDTAPFILGTNMAATPGQVVFRNDLIELIQYQPATEQVGEIPLLVCPPWINRYYILDLAPGRSLVEWAVAHGITTFAISYRNPDASMRDFGLDDYLLKGPRTAIDVVRDITGSETVNNLSVCLGGTLNTALLAYLDATGDRGLVNSSTSLNCLVDHAGAGTLSDIFTDEATLAGLERKMAKLGFLEATDMAHTFDLLRANDLIFSYVASGWLCGEQPTAFDMLAWNHDSTRMPATMHAFYLRQCWIDNSLAEDRMELCGERLIVSGIDVDSYIVAAVDDHIVPWHSSYRTTQLIKGQCRFVLSSSGHIAGIVNPPNPKSSLWTNEELPPDPDDWWADASQHSETWWNDWMGWILPRSGDLRKPPAMGSADHSVLEPAPGAYVRS